MGSRRAEATRVVSAILHARRPPPCLVGVLAVGDVDIGRRPGPVRARVVDAILHASHTADGLEVEAGR